MKRLIIITMLLVIAASCSKEGAILPTSESNNDVIPKEEALEWFNNLPGECMRTFIEFVEGMPSMVLDYEVKCPSCGNTRSFKAVSVLDFFTSSTAQTE